MKRLSESFIDDVISRSRNNDERQEDKFHLNIDELECGPFLGGVYWATDQLEVEDEYAVSIETFKKIKPSQLKGWRLPREDEFKKMVKDAYIYSQSSYDSYAFEKPGKEGQFVALSELERMQIQEEGLANTIYYSFNGAVVTDYVPEDKETYDDFTVVVQLVRDDKI